MIKRTIALALALILVLTLGFPAFGEETGTADDAGKEISETEKETKEVHISTADELQSYALQCRLDTYSDNTIVYLDKSINLKDVPFYPFPSFSGTFDGQGNTISGFVNAENGSFEGLFRYVEEEGRVINLTVKGSENFDEDNTDIGGIAGSNYGLIEKCTFIGTVSGQENVGGICGSNYGKIVDCQTEGTVSGKNIVGGICGYNNGSIYRCVNKSTVNPEVWEDNSGAEVSSISFSNLSQLNITELISENNSNTTTDVGGIAGYSDHIIYVCTNYGTIGYQHYGYNVGGIAGRQSNFISKCINYGSVFGRNDVGGIVGQNEPYMNLTDRETMSGEIQSLSDNFDNTMSTLGDDTDKSSDIVDDIATDTGNVFESTEDALNDTGRLDALEDDIEEDYGIKTELNDMDNVQIIEGGNEEDESSDSGLIDKALDKTKETSANVDKDYIENVRNNAENAKGEEAWDVASDALKDAGINYEADEETSKTAKDKADSVSDEINSRVGSDTVDRVLSGEATDDDISNIIYEGTDAGIEGIEDSSDWISARRTERKAEEQESEDQFIDDVTSGASSLVSLGDNYSLLGKTLKETMSNFTSNFKDVNEHLTNIMNMLADALAGNFNTDVMKDISELNDDESMYGTVTNSTNYGSIDGDESVGGIAGAMSIDSDYDLDGVISDTIASTGLFTNTYETTCIVRACENNGEVNSKHDNTGGIVGKQDMGLIIGSENYGDVSGTGNNNGGVVGLSYSTVNTCYSKCTVSGTDYLGGIAGNGSIIYDCISFSNIQETDGAYIGAIAGYADMEAEREVEVESGISSEAFMLASNTDSDEESSYTFVQENCVAGNFFVNDELGGVNGVSYDGLAEPVTYKTAMDYSGLPEKLRKWEIRFIADGKVVDTVEFEYGGSIKNAPAVPEKEGYTGFWEEFETENLVSSRDVNAIYIENGNTIESSLRREDTDLCVVLVEGALHSDTSVKASFNDEYKGTEISEGEIEEAVTVELQGTIPTTGEYIIHYNLPSERNISKKVYVKSDDGRWNAVQTLVQGSYLVFYSTVPVTFAVVSSSHAGYIIAGSIALAAAAAVICILCFRKKKSGKKSEEQLPESDSPLDS